MIARRFGAASGISSTFRFSFLVVKRVKRHYFEQFVPKSNSALDDITNLFNTYLFVFLTLAEYYKKEMQETE